MKKNIFCMTMYPALIVGASLSMMVSVTTAEENTVESEKVVSISPATKSTIFINPETGEVDSSPEPETVTATQVALGTQKTAQPEETITQLPDGSIRIDFNGKYMMPVYGHVNSNGTVSLSHDDTEQGKEE